MILVSACLIGENCKYSGGNNKNERVIKYLEEKDYIAICPETLGGLVSPRSPAEIQQGDGRDVLNGTAKVVSCTGEDFTAQFLCGAKKVCDIAQNMGADTAILKESSPSCGSGLIYDGSFCGNKKKGCGVTAALLRHHGIRVISEENLDKSE